MKLFKYEIHTHASEVSKCGKITAPELVRFYKKIGFSGVCITDHFLNANTTVPKELPWAERVQLFCKGYELAYAEGQRIGMEVFFGWEYSYRGTHLLTYGLDKQWLLEHPDLLTLRMDEYCDLVRDDGGIIVHAHPFREAAFIDMIRLLPHRVDAVEVDNASRSDFENHLADQYADNYDLVKVVGTDNHVGPRKRLCGVQVKRRLRSVDDLIRAIVNGEAENFVLQFSDEEKPKS